MTSPAVRMTIFEEVSSTNDTILAAGERGEPEGTTHLALSQTQGRGRADHEWWSPRGAGLWMSTLLRPRLPRERWSAIALAAGRAVQEALTELGVRSVDLEWPNDLVVGRRKLGGILCEVRNRGADAWIALGIGINLDLESARVRRTIPARLRDAIICTTAAGPPATRDPERVGRTILDAFWPLYERYSSGERIGEIVGDGLAHRGRPVRVTIAEHAVLSGTIVGLGPSGELLVRTDDGNVQRILAGDVEYL